MTSINIYNKKNKIYFNIFNNNRKMQANYLKNQKKEDRELMLTPGKKYEKEKDCLAFAI